MEDGKDDKTRVKHPAGNGEGSPAVSHDDEVTRPMPGTDTVDADDDVTRIMNPADSAGVQHSTFSDGGDDVTQVVEDADDVTRVMPTEETPDDDVTRVMNKKDALDDDVTRVMVEENAPDDDVTRVMVEENAPDDDVTRVMGADAADDGPDVTRVMGDANDTLANAEDAVADDTTRVMGQDDATDSTQVQSDADVIPPLDDTGMADIRAELDAGKMIIRDRFVLETLLGAGGMGSVYKAKDLRKVEARDRNPWVAVKLLNEDFKTHPLAFISLQREARKSQTLSHPNIIQVFDFDREGDMVYMTMELLEGNDLNHFIRENSEGVELEEALRLTRAMGGALQHAHANKITHADFKPANVFLSENGIPKVLDFGIAQAIAHADVGPADDDKTAFDPGSLGALTPAYASLEMLQGKDPLPADDLYALGCMAYQLLCGKHPYDKMPADEALEKARRPAKIDSLNRRQWRALQKAIELKRENRFEAVDEFLDEFAPIENPWAKRLGVAVGVALVLGGVGVYQAVSNYYEDQNRTAEVREREARVAAEASRIAALQQAKDALASSFSGLQSDVESAKGKLSQHRFAFESGGVWKQRMESQLEGLRQLFRNDDWKTLVRVSEELDATTAANLLEGEQERRDAATQSAETWISGYQEKVAKDYLQMASVAAADGHFADASAAIEEARALDSDSSALLATNRELERLVAANREENQAIAVAAREAAREAAQLRLEADFLTSDAEIKADLGNCTTNLSRTGRGGTFTYSIPALADKIATLRTRYAALGESLNTAVDSYVAELGACIQLYGYADPTSATQQLASAKRSFPAHASELSKLSIHPWDTCKSSFAGKGSRYDCQDRHLGGSDKGPTLVVIPGGNGMQSFAIGKYEISEGEFNAWCDDTSACVPSELDAALPVTGRSAQEITGYVAWLSQVTGFHYQLPAREQWLYAADAMGTGLDPGRNCTLESRGIMKGQVMLPVEVGAENGWGLIHHVGNAKELVKDAGGFAAVGGSRVDPIDDCTVQAIAPADAAGDGYTGFRVIRTRN